MKRHLLLFSGVLLFGFGLMGTQLMRSEAENAVTWNADTPVADVLKALGEDYPSHRPADLSPENVQRGKEIFHQGYTTGPDGKKTRIQSRYFVCTNCHNTAKEDPDLRISDPEARLDYVLKNRMPFLPATTMYGTVNKVSWYNDDYIKKYGDFVRPAYKSLEYAIHLCATVCSQGRDFEEWEKQAVLAYYWSIQYKLGDLSLTSDDWKKLRESEGKGQNAETAKWLKGFYRSGSPATFLEAPEDKGKGYEVSRKPDAKRGLEIYNNSCLMCHDQQGPSEYLKLDNGQLSLSLFREHFKSKGHLSLYEIVRHGTYADTGHRAYMPNFTAERLSNEQVEDLRAYMEQGNM
jgi:mono/diheme cytochrome c family protein